MGRQEWKQDHINKRLKAQYPSVTGFTILPRTRPTSKVQWNYLKLSVLNLNLQLHSPIHIMIYTNLFQNPLFLQVLINLWSPLMNSPSRSSHTCSGHIFYLCFQYCHKEPTLPQSFIIPFSPTDSGDFQPFISAQPSPLPHPPSLRNGHLAQFWPLILLTTKIDLGVVIWSKPN